MANIDQIIRFIDEYLEKNRMSEITPVEANKQLEKAGILRDSEHRPGLPLRNLLRADKIPHAYQDGGKYARWHIPHS